jgi:hypothetical protein
LPFLSAQRSTTGRVARQPEWSGGCEPNIGFAGNIVLVAMRDVEPGEELTTDYAMFDDDGVMDCNCGRTSCRRCISGRDWQRGQVR